MGGWPVGVRSFSHAVESLAISGRSVGGVLNCIYMAGLSGRLLGVGFETSTIRHNLNKRTDSMTLLKAIVTFGLLALARAGAIHGPKPGRPTPPQEAAQHGCGEVDVIFTYGFTPLIVGLRC
jgi:hypothetical protein